MLVSSALMDALAQVSAKLPPGVDFDEKKIGNLLTKTGYTNTSALPDHNNCIRKQAHTHNYTHIHTHTNTHTAASSLVHKPSFLSSTAPGGGWANAQPTCTITIPTELKLADLKVSLECVYSPEKQIRTH